METQIVFQGKNDAPQLAAMLLNATAVVDLTHIMKMTFCLVEDGMSSGEPSVAMAVEADNSIVVIQTSLDKFLMAATGMIAGAESRWGWKRPEGHATLMPPSKKDAKAMLEAIKKELEEWVDEE